MKTISYEEARKVFHHLMLRATTDPLFRQALLLQPRQALEQALGVCLPAHCNIRFVENHGADMTIVLPDPVSSCYSGHILSGDDLGFVAGGVDVAVLAEMFHLRDETFDQR
jgi:hypothetical protein